MFKKFHKTLIFISLIIFCNWLEPWNGFLFFKINYNFGLDAILIFGGFNLLKLYKSNHRMTTTRGGFASELAHVYPRLQEYQAPARATLCISFPCLMAIRNTIILFFSVAFLSSQNRCSVAQKWIKAGYWYGGSDFPIPDKFCPVYTPSLCICQCQFNHLWALHPIWLLTELLELHRHRQAQEPFSCNASVNMEWATWDIQVHFRWGS